MIYLVDPKYNPWSKEGINSSTALGPGITMAKFLGSLGTRVQFEQLELDATAQKSLAGQLYLQAEAMRSAINNKTFRNNRLIVAEGVYKPAITETITPDSINDYKTTGRAVVYQLLDKEGNIDLENTFDLALYWKDYLQREELILDYDTYDPSGKLCAQIIVVMPKVDNSFNVSFTNKLKTTYNNNLLSVNEIIEVLPTV